MDRPWYPVRIDHWLDETGTLSVVEGGRQVPFDIKRVFWLSGIPSTEIRRGAHAHAELQQVLFAASGHCLIDLETVSGTTETLELNHGGDALYLDGPVWRTMHGFSADCVLMVLCDRDYASDHVVRDREEFLNP